MARSARRSRGSGSGMGRGSLPRLSPVRGRYTLRGDRRGAEEGRRPQDWKNDTLFNRTHVAGAGKDSV